MSTNTSTGRLMVVGTPIGNLGDLTPRAAETLRTADLVVAEDTRVAARLLAHIGARTATQSFNEHNAAARLPGLLSRLAAGQMLALTTDAGMPGVSDPGAVLVAAAREAGATVEVVPGPTAVTAAVALSGVEATGFLFGGFLPARPASLRAATLDRLLAAARTAGLPLVVYEAPHRVNALLSALDERVPEVIVTVARELTKRHEEVVVGSPSDVASRLSSPRGEFTLIVTGMPTAEPAGAGPDVGALIEAGRMEGLSDRSLVGLLRAAGVSRREAYRAVEAHRSA